MSDEPVVTSWHEPCGIIFPDPDSTTRHIVISCEQQVGHTGAHRGFDSTRMHGAIWEPERLLKVHEGGRQGSDITKEPA